MKDFFPESLGQKRGCTLYMAKYGIWWEPDLNLDLGLQSLTFNHHADQKPIDFVINRFLSI